MKKLTIGYFADGPWAYEAFQKFKQDCTIEIGFICIRYNQRDLALIECGKKYGIDVIWSENINSDEFLQKIEGYHVDIFVSMSFNQIFKERMINFPKYKTINCHAGKLPFYRGRNVLNWVLINDEKEFGITCHYVDEGIDTGDIILQGTYQITDEDDYSTLLSRAYTGCAEVLYDSVKAIQNGTNNRIPQSSIDAVGIYCGGRMIGDEIINWNQGSRDIFNFVRAICRPGPQATCYLNNSKVLINKVRMVEGAHIYKGIPGQVLGKTKNGWYVKTADSMVEILEYDSEEKIKVGSRLKPEMER